MVVRLRFYDTKLECLLQPQLSRVLAEERRSKSSPLSTYATRTIINDDISSAAKQISLNLKFAHNSRQKFVKEKVFNIL